MTAQKVDAYRNTPEFGEALHRFQAGEWEAGLAQLEALLLNYPYSKELRHFFDEMQLRSQIDVYEREDRRFARGRRARKWFFSLSTLALIAVLLVWGAGQFSTGITGAYATAQAIAATQAASANTSWIYNNAVVYLNAGQYQEAKLLFLEVLEKDVEGKYEVAPYLQDIEDKLSMNSEYEAAMASLRAGNCKDGLAMLEELKRKNFEASDLDLQMESAYRCVQFSDMIAIADINFNEGQWDQAVEAYTKVRALDPEYRQDYIKKQLFNSYIQAADAVLAKPEVTLDDLTLAESNFGGALSLFPQDKSVRGRLAEVRERVEEATFNSLVERARQALVGRSDSLEAMEEADVYWTQALNIRPGDQQIQVERELARRYITAQAAFLNGNWAAVIEDMEYVLGVEKDYANKTARQTLYEAYIARGDGGMASGLYEGAISDYRTAAVLATQDPDSLYRLYEIQLKLANGENILGNYESAVRLYRSASDISGFRDRAARSNPNLAQKVDDAEFYAGQANYRLAARYYREALQGLEVVYEPVVHKVVEGEYLTKIAALYGSSVSAIVDANDIANANKIFAGQELIIPVMKTR